jgi:predicted ArsR family transcriptional regulator
MNASMSLSEERRLELDAEIIHHLWEQGPATIAKLSEQLKFTHSRLRSEMDDLSARHWIYLLWASPQGQDLSVYCLTSRAAQTLQRLSENHTRYRLRKFWDALQREQRGLPSPTIKI